MPSDTWKQWKAILEGFVGINQSWGSLCLHLRNILMNYFLGSDPDGIFAYFVRLVCNDVPCFKC